MAEDSFWLRPLAWDIAFFCLWIWSDLIQFEIEPHNNLQMRFVLPPLVSGTKSHTGNTGCWLQGSWQDRVGWSGVGKRQVKMPDFHSIFKLFFFFFGCRSHLAAVNLYLFSSDLTKFILTICFLVFLWGVGGWNCLLCHFSGTTSWSLFNVLCLCIKVPWGWDLSYCYIFPIGLDLNACILPYSVQFIRNHFQNYVINQINLL